MSNHTLSMCGFESNSAYLVGCHPKIRLAAFQLRTTFSAARGRRQFWGGWAAVDTTGIRLQAVCACVSVQARPPCGRWM